MYELLVNSRLGPESATLAAPGGGTETAAGAYPNTRVTLSGLWGFLGLVAVLADALYRLTPIALEPFTMGMTTVEWVLYVFTLVIFAYAEGYRGFHRAFAPRAVARAFYVGTTDKVWLKVLAPLFCMALVHATRRRLIANWILVFGIVAVVIAVRAAGGATRVIVDAGVVAGLSLGTLSLLYHYLVALRGRPTVVPLELPES